MDIGLQRAKAMDCSDVTFEQCAEEEGVKKLKRLKRTEKWKLIQSW